ncbi:MAG: PRC-barrel domain containing protein [Gemmatimonadetes bacterium]|nr:PRC-barrel domain containing protein [Gemmatimonadota bacterium]
MLRNLNRIRGYGIEARDGSIGSVRDFFLDGANWCVRYVMVDTGQWLPGRRVLIAPAAIDHIDDERRRVSVNLMKRGVEDSPSVREHLPVSLRKEFERNLAMNWPHVMLSPAGAPILTLPPNAAGVIGDQEPHLRSLDELTGYGIEARDGSIGRAHDVIVSEEDFKVRLLVVDTNHWLPGRKVLIDPDWVEGISWADRRIVMGLSRKEIEESPEYDESTAIDHQYVERLYAFYGRPRNWSIGTPI